MEPTRFCTRFRLSIGDGMAIEESNARYVDYEDYLSVADELSKVRQCSATKDLLLQDSERFCQLMTNRVAEAARLLQWATARYPDAITPQQCRDAHAWLAKLA